jgi:hypothetical protein
MAYDESVISISLNADASIGVYTGVPGQPGSTDPNGGYQYLFVKVTGANTAGLAGGGTTEQVIGVLQNKPQKVNAPATVAIAGVVQIVAGGTVAAGDPIKSSAAGKAVTGTPGTDKILGVALKGGANNTVIPVLLRLN